MSPAADTKTRTQISSGGVAYRETGGRLEVAIISVGGDRRWQLPKGMVARGESNEDAALREVREEAGISTEMVDLLDKIEYWYYATSRGQRTRVHKYVYFYLLRYLSGDPEDHDHEVNEARWVGIDEAIQMLTFETERQMVIRAKEKLVPAEK